MSEDTLVTLFVEGRLSGSSEVKLNKGYLPEILPVIRESPLCVVGNANISYPLTRLCRELPSEGALKITPWSLRDSSHNTCGAFITGRSKPLPYRFVHRHRTAITRQKEPARAMVLQGYGYIARLHACSLTRLCRERLAAARSPRDLTSLMSFNTLGFATLPPGRSLKDNALVVM